MCFRRHFLSLSCLLFSSVVWAAGQVTPFPTGPGNGPNAMMANSPFNAYTSHVVTYVLITTVLVLTLLVGGFLVVNLSMMSKRSIDKDYSRQEPSDVGILKGERFGTGNLPRILPPEEEQDEITSESPPTASGAPESLLQTEKMPPDFRGVGGMKKAG